MASRRYKLTKDKWNSFKTGVNTYVQITHNTGNTSIFYTELEATPTTSPDKSPICNYSKVGDSIAFTDVPASCGIHLFPVSKDAEITITVKEISDITIDTKTGIAEVK